MAITIKNGKLDFEFSDAVKMAGATAIGAGGAAIVVGGGSTAAVVAGSGATTLLAAEALDEASNKEGVEKIDHQAPSDPAIYNTSEYTPASGEGSGNSARDQLTEGIQELFAAGLLSVEEVSGPAPSSPEIYGCATQKSGRSNSTIYR